MDPLVEVRELRYFDALARELHFGNAARALGIAQPALTRALQRLERRLGVTLLERTSRQVRLTPAGEVLAAEASVLLESLRAATERTRRAGAESSSLVLAMKPGGDGGLLDAVHAEYAKRVPDTPLEVIVNSVNRSALVQSGEADAAFLFLPYDTADGLDTEPLHAEVQVAVVPAAHPLAGRTSISVSDLDGEPRIEWDPLGLAPSRHATDLAQAQQLVALGNGVLILPHSSVEPLRADLTYLPIDDLPEVTFVIAWPAGSRSKPTAALVEAVLRANESWV